MLYRVTLNKICKRSLIKLVKAAYFFSSSSSSSSSFFVNMLNGIVSVFFCLLC
ncbi:hypothetical protein ACMBCN_00810 [Candidatus Liberibacter asiaticus]|nr:hypothetical protein [Candidatus Liberibacter asiaticus]